MPMNANRIRLHLARINGVTKWIAISADSAQIGESASVPARLFRCYFCGLFIYRPQIYLDSSAINTRRLEF